MAGGVVVFVCGTFDTKAMELAFIARHVRSAGAAPVVVDLSTSTRCEDIDVAVKMLREVGEVVMRESVCEGSLEHVLNAGDEGRAIAAMQTSFIAFLKRRAGTFDGIIGCGGSGGTALVAPALQTLPVGLPKVIVTTMAAGDITPYIGGSDICILPSVTDVAGLNRISRAVFANAGAMVAAMAAAHRKTLKEIAAMPERSCIGLTMFGVTTPMGTAVRKALEAKGFEVLVFHATGAGGRSMEKLIRDGVIHGILDLTTTEIADEIVGGVLSSGPERLDVLASTSDSAKIPAVISVGATDMVNFAAVKTVPEKFMNRKLHVHNSNVTLMRTSVAESRDIAAFIATKLNRATGPLEILLPLRGVSALDGDDAPFDDAHARAALFDELESTFVASDNSTLRTLDLHINDKEFASECVATFVRLWKESGRALPAISVNPVASLCPSKSSILPNTSALNVAPTCVEGPRDAALVSLRAVVSSGKPIVGAGAGTGISAKFEEEGGADLIVVYNSGKFRMAGYGSLAGLLPFKDANAMMLEMGNEIIPIVRHTPVLAGVCATDPFRSMSRLLKDVKDAGFVGVQNFPTVGLYDGTFRQNIEETGFGFEKEVNMIRLAREMGLLTTPYVFDCEQARMMVAAGADVIVAHMGLTSSGSVGASTVKSLDACVTLINAIANVARDVSSDVLVLCHGGPIATPADAEFIQTHCQGVDGFYGASSVERLPVEGAIVAQVRSFKSTKVWRSHS